MEKTFTNAVLLGATVIVACLVVFPPLHLWAQNKVHIDKNVKVHKAVVENVDGANALLTVNIDDADVSVRTNASTTIALGSGDEGTLDNLDVGVNVYVFGTFDEELQVINAEKIVIRNKPITGRTTLSRAEQERANSIGFSSLSVLGLNSK